ncbi:10022_t:CDS:2, partial [Cetraspora pellucida]
ASATSRREEFSIEIADFNPIGPTAYIPLPETLPKHNNGIINIQNDDDWCFRWSVLGALHPVKVHLERNLHHLYGAFMEELNMDDIPILVPASTLVYKKFEENNPEIKRRVDEYKQVNLLVITEEERSHYCIIKDLHKLIRYNEHLPKCKGLNNAPQQPQMPVKNRSIKAFYNHKCMQPNPYHIFWNLEMLTEKLTSEKKTKLTHTERLQMHKPCGYCYIVVHMNSSLNYEIISHDLYRDPDVLERFVTKIEKKLANIQEDLFVSAEMIIAPKNLKAYNKESCMEKEHPKKKEKKFDKTSLPSKKDFYSLLSQQNISKEDYEHAQKTNVLLLVDVFINYIIICLKDDGLDSSHYVSASGMFNDSLYKSSRVELKLMADMDEYLIVENGIYRGMTMANMNALYSDAMTQYMLTEILDKVSPEEVPDIQSIASDTKISYILKVDLEAPVYLYNYFADYPLVPEKQIISEN